MERFLVVGSNSFSGASFVARLLRVGAEVVGVSRSPEPVEAFLPYRWAGTSGSFRFVQADLNRDLDCIMAVAEQLQPQYVVNFAAQSMVAESWVHPEHWYQTNVVANVRFHDRLRKLANLQKYVHVSTPEVYGTCEGTITENAPFNPSTPYAASRAACDLHLNTFRKQYDFPVVITRAANVYGPGQRLYRIIPRTILFAKLGRRLKLHGGGGSIRSFIHIDDVSDATLTIARHAPPGEVYHLSTGHFLSIRELVERVCATLGVSFADVVEDSPERPGKDAAYLLDSAKARRTLGWTDRVTLDRGIRQTVDWVTSSFDVLTHQPFDYVHKA